MYWKWSRKKGHVRNRMSGQEWNGCWYQQHASSDTHALQRHLWDMSFTDRFLSRFAGKNRSNMCTNAYLRNVDQRFTVQFLFSLLLLSQPSAGGKKKEREMSVNRRKRLFTLTERENQIRSSRLPVLLIESWESGRETREGSSLSGHEFGISEWK